MNPFDKILLNAAAMIAGIVVFGIVMILLDSWHKERKREKRRMRLERYKEIERFARGEK